MAVEEDESEPVTESELEDEGEINAWVDNGDSWVLFQSVHGPFWRNITKKRSPVAPAVASVAVKGPVAFSCSRYSHLDSGHHFFDGCY